MRIQISSRKLLQPPRDVGLAVSGREGRYDSHGVPRLLQLAAEVARGQGRHAARREERGAVAAQVAEVPRAPRQLHIDDHQWGL